MDNRLATLVLSLLALVGSKSCVWVIGLETFILGQVGLQLASLDGLLNLLVTSLLIGLHFRNRSILSSFISLIFDGVFGTEVNQLVTKVKLSLVWVHVQLFELLLFPFKLLLFSQFLSFKLLLLALLFKFLSFFLFLKSLLVSFFFLRLNFLSSLLALFDLMLHVFNPLDILDELFLVLKIDHFSIEFVSEFLFVGANKLDLLADFVPLKVDLVKFLLEA